MGSNPTPSASYPLLHEPSRRSQVENFPAHNLITSRQKEPDRMPSPGAGGSFFLQISQTAVNFPSKFQRFSRLK